MSSNRFEIFSYLDSIESDYQIKNNRILIFMLQTGDKFQFENNKNDIFSVVCKRVDIDKENVNRDNPDQIDWRYMWCYIDCVNIVRPQHILHYMYRVNRKVIKIDHQIGLNFVENMNKELSENINNCNNKISEIKRDIQNIKQIKVIDSNKGGLYYYDLCKHIKKQREYEKQDEYSHSREILEFYKYSTYSNLKNLKQYHYTPECNKELIIINNCIELIYRYEPFHYICGIPDN